jgi:hypothetical protein
MQNFKLDESPIKKKGGGEANHPTNSSLENEMNHLIA